MPESVEANSLKQQIGKGKLVQSNVVKLNADKSQSKQLKDEIEVMFADEQDQIISSRKMADVARKDAKDLQNEQGLCFNYQDNQFNPKKQLEDDEEFEQDDGFEDDEEDKNDDDLLSDSGLEFFSDSFTSDYGFNTTKRLTETPCHLSDALNQPDRPESCILH